MANIVKIDRANLKTFDDILKRCRDDSLSEAEKGTKFERLMRSYLLALPKFKGLLEKVWLWHDFPYRTDFGTGHDIGIDLVALSVSGEYWAIQCKCYVEGAICRRFHELDLMTKTNSFSKFYKEVA